MKETEETCGVNVMSDPRWDLGSEKNTKDIIGSINKVGL